MSHRLRALLLAVVTMLSPSAALACGGFFCFTQPVDQSAERVLYVQEENKITVHIQISYTGDDEKFSWVLPLMKVPELGVGSDSIFTILEQSTSPQFQLQWQQKPDCQGYSPCELMDAAAGGGAGGGPTSEGGGVQVLKEENVGPYKSVVIKGNSGAELVKWLNDNGYVQPQETVPLVDSYAKQDYVFLALQLQKDKSAGDLAPIVVTLEEVAPCLPLRLTKLAVAPDMPIVTWTLGQHRAIPKNFLHVTINDAVLDWMKPGTNYKTVVSKAVDQASGHAWTTEMAKKTAELKLQFANKNWDTSKLAAITDPGKFLMKLLEDGYPRTTQMQQLIRKHIPKPAAFESVGDQEFYGCIQCDGCSDKPCSDYKAAVAQQTFDAKAFATDVEKGIVEPLFIVQGHFDSIPYLTRMYTTVSADEMDKDPIFAFNKDLPDVERLHTAKAEPLCKEGTNKAHAAKLTFADGHNIEVELPTTYDNCGFDFGGPGSASFGKGTGPLVAAGGQPAYSVEVLDESGPPIAIDPREADKVDAALNDAKVGQASLTGTFIGSLTPSTWDPTKTTVDPLPGGTGGTGGTSGGVSSSSSGCTAGPSQGAGRFGLLLLACAAALLVLRRRTA